jgi:hypothetical protein
MKLYHGSSEIINHPFAGGGNPFNDFGLGFYTTEDRDAALWAVKDQESGFINSYSFTPSNLKLLDLTPTDEKTVLTWLTLLVSHRFSYEEKGRYEPTIRLLNSSFSISLTDYDYIIGYRADDNYFAYSRDFLANTLPIELLTRAMSIGKLGKQIVLLSKPAFQALDFVSAEPVKEKGRYDLFRKETNSQYRELKKQATPTMTYLNEILKRYAHD